MSHQFRLNKKGGTFFDYVDNRLNRGFAGKRGRALRAKGDYAVCKRKKCVVFTNADLLAGEVAGAALAHDNRANLGWLARKEFNPQVFCIGVGKVFS